MNGKIRRVLDGLVERFKSGDVPQAVAYAMFPTADDIPSAKWSLLNRTLMFLAGTADGRGFRQWKEANRFVKKGSRAFHILVPYYRKTEDEQTGEERQMLVTFLSRPVFRYEDTDGETLEYTQIELPDIPLMEKAEEWGISVRAIPGNYRYYGYYSPDRKEIALATPEEKTFLHELSHVAHEKVKGHIKTGQDPLQEIVAELSAQALCILVGKQTNDTVGNSLKYIASYAQRAKLTPHSACLKVLSQTEKVLNLILNDRQEVKATAQMAA